ncbi:Transporter of the ATP-binding cassette (ABC), partial [Coemansia sp. RSA 2603]
PLYSDSPDAIPASAYSELCSNDNASDLTPLAPPRTVDPTDLVDTPEFSSSWFSRMYFVWASSLLEKGVNRQLADTDLYRLDNRDMPGHIWQRFQKHRRDGRSLITTLLITFAPEFTIHGVLSVVDTLLKFSGPFFIQRILRSIDIIGNKSDVGKTATLRSAYLDAFGLLFFSLLTTVASHKTIWIGRQIG